MDDVEARLPSGSSPLSGGWGLGLVPVPPLLTLLMALSARLAALYLSGWP